MKLEKSLGVLEKKRTQLKGDSEVCASKLRSGRHLGQDRYVLDLCCSLFI